MIRRSAVLWLLVLPATAHMVSISTGEAVLEGERLRYRLRMPSHEMTHVRGGEGALLRHIRFRSGAAEALRLAGQCSASPNGASVVCTAAYRFPAPPETIEVESALHGITVPNHTHLLRAVNGGREEHAVLDSISPRRLIRFGPPPRQAQAVRALASGLALGLGGAAQWLLASALALASRNRRELLLITAAFGMGQAAACQIVPMTAWQPAPRFVEAGAAIAAAYLAAEVLLLPHGSYRWAAAGAVGLFQGLYLALFVSASGAPAVSVWLGGLSGQVAAVLGIAALLRRVPDRFGALQTARVAASLVLAAALAWFGLRLGN